jgi:TRAP-type C4-dicarboxylate transport system permease small subunit
MKKLKPIESWVIWKANVNIMEIILAVCSVLLFVLIGASVFVRYIVHASIFGVEEIIAFLAIWLYWIGGVYGSYEKSHISGDLTNIFISTKKGKKIAEIASNVVTVIITGCFAYWSITEYALWNIKSGTKTIGLHIPNLVGNIVLPISFCFMFLYSVYHLVRIIHPAKRAREGGSAHDHELSL